MEKIAITEGQNFQEEWYKEAKEMKWEELPAFLDRLTHQYQHDYGTIVHAMVAGMMATMNAMNREDQGGITGFQAGCIMWELVRKISYRSNRVGLKMQDLDNLLYPQYEYEFQNTITEETWALLQKIAGESVVANDAIVAKYAEDLAAYTKALEEKENGAQIELPEVPWDQGAHPEVAAHWRSIVAGHIPHGFYLEDDPNIPTVEQVKRALSFAAPKEKEVAQDGYTIICPTCKSAVEFSDSFCNCCGQRIVNRKSVPHE